MPSPKIWPEFPLPAALGFTLCIAISGHAGAASVADAVAELAQGSNDAIQSLALRAGAGEAEALYALGVIMAGSRSDEASQVRASEFLQAAAQAGIAEAADALGNWHFRRRATAKAIDWWGQAAAAGHAGAARKNALAILQDASSSAHPEALNTLKSVALDGNARAQFALAMYLLEHKPEHSVQAERLLQTAAAQGLRAAQQNLGLLLAAGRFPIETPSQEETAASTASGTSVAIAPAPEPTQVRQALRTPRDPLVAGSIFDSDWISEQAPGNYTIQLATGSNLEALKATLRREAGAHPSAWFELPGPSKTLYSAVVGSFPGHAKASEALAALSDNARSTQPWIRRFSELHALLQP